ncbi:MAG: hypothetical protein M1838_005372 [Thelocarpon superellum]|nr:MAG: hypothetical protein M1838_005372 [Thelocarpon superellum]
MASGGDITIPLMLPPPTASTPHESAVEAGLGRKRCITFACGRKAPPTSDIVTAPKKEEEKPASEQAKRPCALRFACPFKDAANDAIKDGGAKPVRQVSPAPTGLKHRPTTLTTRPHRDSESTIRNVSPVATRDMPESSRSQAVAVDPEPKVVRSQATRFHEFASSLEEEDEWMNQASVHQQRITVGDTLRKENAIRQLGEEAEEEALQDEEEEEEALDEDGEGQDGEGDVDDEDEEEISNDGNETDDEGGFADSDDESETGSDYNFWTPARSMAATAATSTDRLDPSYAVSRQTAPGSSIESIPEASPKTVAVMPSSRASRKASRPAKIRPGTPELPDSTDFVCGTLDEDRPLEVAYASCIEERRRSKHMTIPQDIDPSFPTSDTENDDDDDDDNDNRGRDHESHHWSDEHFFISGHLEDHVDDGVRVDGRGMAKRRSPSHSPKRARSPPPARHGQAMRSPPLKSGRMPGDRRSPPPGLAVKTPVPLRPLNLAALAPPLELTRTKSLPRTPNPFSHQHAATHLSTVTFPRPGQGLCRDLHSRGAIDIVKGLEKKRQRRKEKAWYKHCQQRAAKEKERKPQPGKGAERMRELGLEMAGKGGLHNGVRRAQYVLSI